MIELLHVTALSFTSLTEAGAIDQEDCRLLETRCHSTLPPRPPRWSLHSALWRRSLRGIEAGHDERTEEALAVRDSAKVMHAAGVAHERDVVIGIQAAMHAHRDK